MAEPFDETGHRVISLEQRAPVGLIPIRKWYTYISFGPSLIEYENTLEQKKPCVRSQLAHVSFKTQTGIHISKVLNFEITHSSEVLRYPYPTSFRKLLQEQSQDSSQPGPQQSQQLKRGVRIVLPPFDNPIIEQIFKFLGALSGGITNMPTGFSITRAITPIPSNEAGEGTRPGSLADNALPVPDPLAQEEAGLNSERYEWQWGFTFPWFGVIRSSAIESRNPVQPAYVVLDIFPSGQFNPKERISFVHDPEKLFWELRWTVFRLRGWRSSLISLRGVKRFRLFKCNAEDGTHERIHLDKNGDADLQLLLNMYKRWYVSRHIALAWTNWIHHTLNNGSLDVLNGTYAIELVLGWSATRISIAVLLPLLASLITGICLNKDTWTDLATIQTAWGTASYVVTAGGLFAALLAIVSGIAEK